MHTLKRNIPCQGDQAYTPLVQAHYLFLIHSYTSWGWFENCLYTLYSFLICVLFFYVHVTTCNIVTVLGVISYI